MYAAGTMAASAQAIVDAAPERAPQRRMRATQRRMRAEALDLLSCWSGLDTPKLRQIVQAIVVKIEVGPPLCEGSTVTAGRG